MGQVTSLSQAVPSPVFPFRAAQTLAAQFNNFEASRGDHMSGATVFGIQREYAAERRAFRRPLTVWQRAQSHRRRSMGRRVDGGRGACLTFQRCSHSLYVLAWRKPGGLHRRRDSWQRSEAPMRKPLGQHHSWKREGGRGGVREYRSPESSSDEVRLWSRRSPMRVPSQASLGGVLVASFATISNLPTHVFYNLTPFD